MNRKLGSKSVPAIGLGCMGMSEFYGATDDAQSLDTLAQALEMGYRHFDTADMYGSGHNETLLGQFLRSVGAARRQQLLIASKVGLRRAPEDKYKIEVDGSASYIKQACDASLQRLGVEQIDLYYLHRRDPKIELAESLGAMAELVKAGKIGAIGLCEVSSQTLQAAHAIQPIAALQSEYSLWSREAGDEMIPLCEQLGIAFVAFSPMGRGFLTGSVNRDTMQNATRDADIRTVLPRFQAENIEANLRLVERLKSIAAQLTMQASQLALSWILSKHAQVHVIPGTKRASYAATNFSAGACQLDAATLAQLDQIFTPDAVSGGRYPAAILNKSES